MVSRTGTSDDSPELLCTHSLSLSLIMYVNKYMYVYVSAYVFMFVFVCVNVLFVCFAIYVTFSQASLFICIHTQHYSYFIIRDTDTEGHFVCVPNTTLLYTKETALHILCYVSLC